MRNVMVCGFESGPMMEVLKELESEGIIAIKRWLYDLDDCAPCLMEDSIARDKTSLWRGEWQTFSKFPDDNVTDEISQQMDWIMQEFARYKEFFRETYYEYKNLIHHMTSEFYNELYTNHIEIVLFPNIPHGPVNSLLYIVARAMKIETLYVSRYNFFKGKFMYGQTIEDFGNISKYPEYSKEDSVTIEKKYEKKWDYMDVNKIRKYRGKDWNSKLRGITNPVQWIKERTMLLRKNNDIDRMSLAYIERKLVRMISDSIRKTLYKKNVENTERNVDLNCDFVYVPLHLQPEMTVDTIGGYYRDQLLAVEKVRNIIPKEWYIFLKESPFQMANARDSLFFKRLKTISKVKFVPRSMNTYDLISKSKFVATITGTAAWESVTGGKPALAFGVPWYQEFPGIIRYRAGITWKDIVEQKWEHKDLEKMTELINRRLCIGYWLKEDIEKLSEEERVNNFYELKKSMTFIFVKGVKSGA